MDATSRLNSPARPTAWWPPTAALLLLALAWDATGLDLPLARLAGGADGFAWRDTWLLRSVLHEGARRLSWLLALALCIAVWWPAGPLRRLPRSGRLRLAAGVLLSAGAVSLAKAFSSTSCPWDLADFGGWAHYVPHWAAAADDGRGRCFPAGHASAGFSFVGGFFAYAPVSASLARAWLAASLAAGLVLGVAQQLRGAHFMSHTLWTACLCWAVSAAVHGLGRSEP